jgi:hypothetical protein
VQKSTLRKLAAVGSPFLDALPMSLGVIGRTVLTGMAVLTTAFAATEVGSAANLPTNFAIVIPLTDTLRRVIGVLVFVSAQACFFAAHDLDLLSPFTTLFAVSLQNANLEAELYRLTGGPEAEWVADGERDCFSIPEALQLTPDERVNVSLLNWFTPDSQGTGEFKKLFHFFQHFQLFDLFHITAARFFRFLAAMSARYTDTPYHDWTHACGVTQCTFLMLTSGRVVDEYELWQVVCLLTAAV